MEYQEVSLVHPDRFDIFYDLLEEADLVVTKKFDSEDVGELNRRTAQGLVKLMHIKNMAETIMGEIASNYKALS